MRKNRLTSKGVSFSLTVRPFLVDEWQIYRGLRLRALADSPSAFGGTLEHEGARTDEQWSDGLARGMSRRSDLPLVAIVNDEPVGLAWGRVDSVDPQVVHVYQMWVAPPQRKLGIGGHLLRRVINWATTVNARCVRL